MYMHTRTSYRYGLIGLMTMLALVMPVSWAQAALPTRPQALPAITLTVDAGYGGYTKQDTWTPLRIGVTSTETVDGELVLEDTNQENSADKIYAPVTLVKNARRQVVLYAPPGRTAVNIKFYTNGVELSSTPVTVRQLANTDRLVVVSGEPLDGFNFLGDLRTPLGGRSFLAQMRLDQMPDHVAAWNAVDVFIVNNVDSALLTEAQKGTVRAWVVNGGHLIVGGGPGARLTAPPWGDILPARTGAATNGGQGSLMNLNAFVAANRIEPIAEVPTQTTTIPLAPMQIVAPDAQILVNGANAPLIVRRNLGRGLVDQLAFDATIAPLRDWSERVQLFATLFGGRVGQPQALGPLRAEDAASKAAKAIPAAGLPSFLMILIFLTLYIGVLGPLNFTILRKFNRLMWAWVTIPFIVFLFSAVGFVASVRMRGSQVLSNRVSLVYGDARVNEGNLMEFVGVFAPRRVDLNLNTQRGFGMPIREFSTVSSSARPLAPIPVTMRQSDVTRVEKIGVSNTEMKSFFVRGEAVLPKISTELRMSSVLKPDDAPTITGVIVNQSNATLEDCVLMASDWQKFKGEFPPGGKLDVNLQLLRHRMRPVIPPVIERFSASGYSGSISSFSSGRNTRYLYSTGDNLNAQLVEWRDYGSDKTDKDNDVGLLSATFGDLRSQAGLGATLACWEKTNRSNVQFDDAQYSDRGLRMWDVPLQTLTVQPDMAIPADLYTWNVASSTSAAIVNDAGLSLEAGKHVFAFTPWLPVRSTSTNANLRISLEFSNSSSRQVLRESSIWIYDWQTQKYLRVRSSIQVANSTFTVPGNYVSPTGEVRMLIDIGSEVLSLTDMRMDAQLK